MIKNLVSYCRILVKHALSVSWVYEGVQLVFGLQRAQERVKPYFVSATKKFVLDVGAGTGLWRRVLPASAYYVCLDADMERLKRFHLAYPSDAKFLCDATKLSLHDDSVDMGLCVSLSHHLTDAHLALLFSELARVIREKIVFLDAVVHPSLISRLLWAFDQGRYPRSEQALYQAMQANFDIVESESYAIWHHYVLLVGKPKHSSLPKQEDEAFLR